MMVKVVPNEKAKRRRSSRGRHLSNRNTYRRISARHSTCPKAREKRPSIKSRPRTKGLFLATSFDRNLLFPVSMLTSTSW
jgi:hypothetical protein